MTFANAVRIHADDLAVLIELASLTEDRSPREERVLADARARVAKARRHLVTVHNWQVCEDCYEMREVRDAVGGKPVRDLAAHVAKEHKAGVVVGVVG